MERGEPHRVRVRVRAADADAQQGPAVHCARDGTGRRGGQGGWERVGADGQAELPESEELRAREEL